MITAESFRSLHQELSTRGAFRAPTARSWVKFLALTAVSLAVTVGVYQAQTPLALLILLPTSLLLGTAIMIGHEAGHGSACEEEWQNDLLITVAFGALSGISTLFWKYKHNVLHHGSPNVPEKDRDLLLGPVALTKAQHEYMPAPLPWFHRHLQAYLFWPLTSFLGILMRIRSLMVLGGLLREGKVDRAWIIDAAAVSLHYVLWLILPSLYVGFGWALAVYLVIFAGVGVMLSYIFMLGHTGLPLVSAWDDRWSLQILTSRTVRLGPVGRFFWVGLDAQLAHHLFPKISHFNLPLAEAPVRDWCVANGLPPVEQGLRKATVDVARHLKTSWMDEPRDLRTKASAG